MTPFRRRLLRAGVNIEALMRRARSGVSRLISSSESAARRESGRFEALKRREQEAERLDRIRNPRDYEGK